MRLASYALLLAIVSFSVWSQAQGTKDPQAITLLNACLLASGGLVSISTINDFSASGSVTYYWASQNVQGTVTLKALGTTDFRLDGVTPSGNRSWAVTNNTGTLLDVDGTRTTISYANALNVGILNWPLPNIVATLSNAVANVSYLGLVQSDAGQAYQVHVQITDSTNPDPTYASLYAIDYFFDPNTAYLLETLDTLYPVTSLSAGLQHEVLFSNYQTVSGVLVPFSVTEKISGQTTWSVKLTGVSFNVGLTTADFKL